MYWRRIAISVAIIFGTTLWMSPFSAFASNFCVSEVAPIGPIDCPAGSSFLPGGCLPGLTGSIPEHTCTSPVDPCTTAAGGGCTLSCDTGQFHVNSCDGNVTPVCSDQWCVVATTFAGANSAATGGGVTPPITAPPVAVTTDALCTNSANKGVCSASCSGATPNNIGACNGDAAKPVCCSANTAAANTLANDVTTTVKNPLAFSTVEGVLGSLLGALQGIIVVLSLVFILVGAFFYITSAGDEGRMTTAKGAITASMIGLALGLAAPSFLKQIGLILGWGSVPATVDCSAIIIPADLAACNAAKAALDAGKPLSEIAMNILQFLLSIVGVLGIIMLVVGGIVYITASGDEDRIDTGKSIVKYAIIGIAIALASLVAVTQIAALFV